MSPPKNSADDGRDGDRQGMGNRFLFVWVERSQRLPNGGRLPLDELEALASASEMRSIVPEKLRRLESIS